MQDLYSFFKFEPEEFSSVESSENKTIKRNKNLKTTNVITHPKHHQPVWEYRMFWPENAPSVSLASSFFSLSSLDSFRSMVLNDAYILIDHKFLNLKIRHDKLTYKPLVQQEEGMLAYDRKIKFAFPFDWDRLLLLFPRLNVTAKVCSNLSDFLNQLTEGGYHTQLITFEKKVYRCKLQSSLQLEISQFEINHQRWFSLCVEGNNYNLVKQETAGLENSKGYLMGYVEFLKKYGCS